MKKVTLLALTLLSVIILHAQTIEPEKATYIYPKKTFDLSYFENAMKPGSATIKGVAFSGFAGKLDDDGYVNLLPYNEYVQEWISLVLEKDNPKKKTYATMDEKIVGLKQSIFPNSDFEFSFKDVKPGKYILYSFGRITRAGSYGDTVYNIFSYEIIDITNPSGITRAKINNKKFLSKESYRY